MRKKNFFKYLLSLVFTILLRVAPHPPNIEPISAFSLPAAKNYGAFYGAAFAFISLVSFDFISGRLGLWTLYTGVAYALVGFFAFHYLKDKNGKRKHFVACAAVSTIFYDAVTALIFGWQFGQPLQVTLLGQIPFTLYHLLGNVFLAAAVSPAISAWMSEEESVSFSAFSEPRSAPYASRRR